MTMSNGNTGGMTSEINVTPMIDVLLVLLIIFMVIVPALPRGEAALVPHASSSDPHADSVVLEVLRNSGGEIAFTINQQAVARQDLRMRSISAMRQVWIKSAWLRPNRWLANRRSGDSSTRPALFFGTVRVWDITLRGQQQEYNFSILVSVAPARGQVHEIPGARTLGTA